MKTKGYCVLWKEKREGINSYRPEWQEFKNKRKAQSFVGLVKKDPLTKNIRIKRCK